MAYFHLEKKVNIPLLAISTVMKFFEGFFALLAIATGMAFAAGNFLVEGMLHFSMLAGAGIIIALDAFALAVWAVNWKYYPERK